MNVFVTDGDQRPALAVTRCLGRRGITVWVGEEKANSLTSSSKYCTGHITYPSPCRDPRGFCRSLVELVQRTQFDLVIPMTDVTTYLLSLHKKELEAHLTLPVPEFEVFNFVSNKGMLLKHAQEIGIPIPRTHFVEGAESWKELLDQLDFPVVVKPSRSRILMESRWLSTHVHYANSERELFQLYEEVEYLRYPSLIQERILGPGLGVFLLFDRGKLLAAFGHRRLREKPPSGGVSTLRESIPVAPGLKEYAIRLLKPLQWHGVAMMEYKLDRRTGQPLLMEVNGRFWGSLQLAIDAGMDFPYWLYCLARAQHVDIPEAYRVGVKSRWLLGDLDHMLLRVFKKDENLHLPDDFPSRLRTLLRFFKFYEPGMHYEILSLRDPRPFLYEFSQYLRGVFGIGRLSHG
jgi:predicted ATP-grasp superfamily ATP-dependent carboligase